jgi:dTMP kinase
MDDTANKGKLIALEGIDNAGKTSHITHLKDKLEARGIKCLTTKELTSDIGILTLNYLKTGNFSPHLKTLMFAADRQERVEREVIPAINAGQIVLADRWVLSAIVYRAVEDFDTEYVMAVNALTLKPDFIFLIDITAEESMHREEHSDKFNPYTEDFLRKARQHYLAIADQFPNIEVIDGALRFDEINDYILDKIGSLIKES